MADQSKFGGIPVAEAPAATTSKFGGIPVDEGGHESPVWNALKSFGGGAWDSIKAAATQSLMNPEMPIQMDAQGKPIVPEGVRHPFSEFKPLVDMIKNDPARVFGGALPFLLHGGLPTAQSSEGIIGELKSPLTSVTEKGMEALPSPFAIPGIIKNDLRSPVTMGKPRLPALSDLISKWSPDATRAIHPDLKEAAAYAALRKASGIHLQSPIAPPTTVRPPVWGGLAPGEAPPSAAPPEMFPTPVQTPFPQRPQPIPPPTVVRTPIWGGLASGEPAPASPPPEVLPKPVQTPFATRTKIEPLPPPPSESVPPPSGGPATGGSTATAMNARTLARYLKGAGFSQYEVSNLDPEMWNMVAEQAGVKAPDKTMIQQAIFEHRKLAK